MNNSELSEVTAAANVDVALPAATVTIESAETAVVPDDDVAVRISKRRRSIAWEHFTSIERKKPTDKEKSKCNHCGVVFACDTRKNGTTSMLTHIESNCLGLHKKGQQTLGFKPKSENGEVKLVSMSFSLEACRLALAEMIIIDELPFKFVENEGFKRLMHVVQPKWVKIPCRTTIARDCFDVYLKEHKVLKQALKGQRICLTTDTWTSLQNLNYMCLTAHYIDSEWKYHKKILNFCLVTSHKGEILGRAIELCLLEWGVDKILTITVDNASSNNNVIEFLKRKTKNRPVTVLNHDFLHMRCCAHILNLIVCDGLKEMDDSVLRVRSAVRYVRSSPARMALFKKCAEKEGLNLKSNVCLDVPTRWNSTYFMLARAVSYQKAFERLEEEDLNYSLEFKDDERDMNVDGNMIGKGKGKKKAMTPPDNYDWEKAKLFVKFLKLFYDATLRFSGSLFVTSNAIFLEIMLIQNAINSLSRNSDIVLISMAHGMQEKFDKYWGKFEKMNMLLYVAVVLVPRYKLKYVKFCLDKIHNEQLVACLMAKIRDGLFRLHDWYVRNDSCVVDSNISTPSLEPTNVVDDQDYRSMFASQFKQHLESENSMSSKSDLEKYLLDGCEDEGISSFDVLGWWKVNSSKYRILSQVARDVLAIPVSTVASESAFSTGGRILDPFKSCLSPKTVEALICAQNWLRSSAINLREVMDCVEQYESYELGDEE